MTACRVGSFGEDWAKIGRRLGTRGGEERGQRSRCRSDTPVTVDASEGKEKRGRRRKETEEETVETEETEEETVETEETIEKKE